jgi:hypothetical protein
VDDHLTRRYEAVLTRFQVSPGTPSDQVRKVVQALVRQGNLRPDAALCLLALYEYMIVQPYGGEITSRRFRGFGGDLFRGPSRLRGPTSRRTEPAQLDAKVGQSLELILTELLERADVSESASSHDVLRAINAVWPELATIFDWA